jgi:hypothetical protein
MINFRQAYADLDRCLVPIFVWLCCSVVLLLFPACIKTLRDTIALGDPSQVGTTQATVLQARRYRGYEVQYTFDLGTRTYTVADEMGRSKLWVNVSKKDWDAIQNGGRSLQVKYLLNNPSISRPLSNGRRGDLSSEFADDCVGLVMSGILIALWLLGGVRLRRHIVSSRPRSSSAHP